MGTSGTSVSPRRILVALEELRPRSRVASRALAPRYGLGASTGSLPSGPMAFGEFGGQFRADGTFSITGEGWPAFTGTWKADGGQVALTLAPPIADCPGTGRYTFVVAGAHVTFRVVDDARAAPDDPRSQHLAARERAVVVPVRRSCAPRVASDAVARAASAAAAGRRFAAPPRRRRRRPASARHVERHDRREHPLAHADSRPRALEPDRLGRPRLRHQRHQQPRERDVQARALRRRRCLGRSLAAALDALRDRQADRQDAVGARRARRRAAATSATSSPPTPAPRRPPTAASSSRGSDRRACYAYDVDGNFRWKVDLGRVDMGAYDIPTYEWGPASSPIIWNGLVIMQCDTQADSFLLALNADTGETVWKTDRDELPSWGTPTVATTPAGPELVTNASNFVRGYDPRTGKELWRLGGSSKITAPTPIFADGLHRRRQRPRAGAADLRRCGPARAATSRWRTEQTASARVAWSKTGRGLVHADAARLRRPALRARQQRRVRRLRPRRPARRSIAQRLPHPSAAASARRPSPPTARSICRTKTATCSSSPPGRRSSTSPRTRWASC